MICIGVSGWRYAGWRGDFYPKGLRQKDELSHVGERMTSVEINGSFYSLQRPTSYQRWRSSVPAGFVFAVKGSRYVTHMKALRDVETPLANFFASGPLALGPTLGPLLWQLPERLEFDEALVRAFLELLPRTHDEAATLAARHDDRVPEDRAATSAEVAAPLRHAVEPRHASWDSDPCRELLREHAVALVHADTAGRWPTMTGRRTSTTSVSTVSRSCMPAATATRRSTHGPPGSPRGTPRVRTPTCTSTTTSTDAPLGTPFTCSTA